MRSKRIAAAAVAALLGTAAALVGLEALVRITGLAPPLPGEYRGHVPHDEIRFTRGPGSTLSGHSDSGEFAYHYEHNSLGFRDTEHPLDTPADTVRIVALGDSFTYGVGAGFDETYLVQVERQLNDRPGKHPRVEIVKLGLPRHFPALERLTLERIGLRFAPDVVLVTLLPNDVIDTRLGVDYTCASDSGYLVPCAALAWREAAVWMYLRSAVARLALRAWSGAGVTDGQQPPWTGVFVDDGPYESDWRALEHELERMQDAARAHDAAFAVVALPQKPPWRDMHAYPETRLARWSAAHGAVFIPTLAALREAKTSHPLYWERDGHCTPAGYAVVAATVAEGLRAHGLVP